MYICYCLIFGKLSIALYVIFIPHFWDYYIAIFLKKKLLVTPKLDFTDFCLFIISIMESKAKSREDREWGYQYKTMKTCLA